MQIYKKIGLTTDDDIDFYVDVYKSSIDSLNSRPMVQDMLREDWKDG